MAFYLRDGPGNIYVSRKEGRRGLTRIEDSVDATTQASKERP